MSVLWRFGNAFLNFTTFECSHRRDAITDTHDIFHNKYKRPHHATRKISNLYNEYKYHLLTLQKTKIPITFEQGSIIIHPGSYEPVCRPQEDLRGNERSFNCVTPIVEDRIYIYSYNDWWFCGDICEVMVFGYLYLSKSSFIISAYETCRFCWL